MKIGILAVQGDFAAHAAMLRELGVATVEVRTPADMHNCDGLILPGGESTTQLQFLQEEGLYETIKRFGQAGGAVFGTCAGAILLATRVKNPEQESLGLLDMTVQRNGYGRQLASDVFTAQSALKEEPLEMVFIRGPIIERTGTGVEILAKHAGKPVIVQKGLILATTFHPELTSDTTVHEYFLKLASEGRNSAPDKDSAENAATPGLQLAEAKLAAAKSSIHGKKSKATRMVTAVLKTKNRGSARKQKPVRAKSSK